MIVDIFFLHIMLIKDVSATDFGDCEFLTNEGLGILCGISLYLFTDLNAL